MLIYQPCMRVKVAKKSNEIMNTNAILIYNLLGINAVTFVLFGIYKLKPKKGWWRIPKKTLLMFALIGRSIETLCGIRLFQHKTKHKKCYINVPVLLTKYLL